MLLADLPGETEEVTGDRGYDSNLIRKIFIRCTRSIMALNTSLRKMIIWAQNATEAVAAASTHQEIIMEIIFFEKPGCGGNARQKAALRAAGYDVIPRNLLTEPWTAADLRLFFGNLPVKDWFNPSAPAIKSGQVKPEALTAETALALMLEQPLLIRRPLLQIGERRCAGFTATDLKSRLGLELPETVPDGCVHANS
ncbi:ArsC/Spx/MgsR family protein [Komagataeibacter sp. FNDCR2]|uniref:ArsC/Spx/MgsR family protein n=1 Tax=Komagataeibacter sp. FNDCR2 TaxID=2878682 RepID=UPI001E603C24|nr:hypothetical protein [Komagataeibacter sp. FNDCR2]